jgi:hypothetical protein
MPIRTFIVGTMTTRRHSKQADAPGDTDTNVAGATLRAR